MSGAAHGGKPASVRQLAAACAVGVVLLGAATFYPRRPDTQEDIAGARYLPPLTRAHAVELDDQRTWIVRDLQRTADGYRAFRAGREIHLDAARVVARPRPRLYLLGTDDLGRDLASRLLHGARRSLLIGLSSVGVAVVLGTLIGLGAALSRRRVDALLMRIVDVIMALPRLLVLLLVATLLPPSPVLLIAVLGGLTWPGLARLVRAEALRLRRTESTSAARASGCSTWRLATLHLLPQLETLLAVTAALRLADTIVLESALAFLGFGAPAGSASLGGIIASGQHALDEAWWVVVFPVVLLGAAVLGLRHLLARSRVRLELPSVA